MRRKIDRWWPYLLLAGLTLLFFAPLVRHPDQTLYSEFSDLWALHLPGKHFLVREWQGTGELPLWCPDRYSGTPFIHDIQVGAFYPLHLPLYFMPEAWLGPALSWLIVLHVLIAGWGSFAYARRHDVNTAGALVAALGYMFAGRWLLHLLVGGHYIIIGIAWLPLVTLLLERAIERGGIVDATLAGACFALIILPNQPQWTFYSGLFVGMWTLAGVLSEKRTPPHPALLRWFLLCACLVIVAVTLSAVQLLPTIEAARLSSRAGGVPAREILTIAQLTLQMIVGPAVSATPHQLLWEERGAIAIGWLALAIMAPFVSRERRTCLQAGVVALLFVYVLGGAAAVQGLPGFNLFRQPARMVMIAAFPLAFLAGVTTHTLWAAPGVDDSCRRRCRSILVLALLGSSILVGSFAWQLSREQHPLQGHIYWWTLLVTMPGLFWLLGRIPTLGMARPARAPAQWAWVGLLLVDLWALAWPAVDVRAEAEVFEPSECVRYLVEQDRDHGRVLDQSPANSKTFPLGTGAPLAMIHDLEALRGYTPLDVRRYKEYLQFIGDDDEPLQALKQAVTYPVIPNFPIHNKQMLDLLGTRYLLQPSSAELPEPASDWEARFTDPEPSAYDCVTGGRRSLGTPYTVYENRAAFPRAFVVPEATPLPERGEVLAALKTNDFRRRVFLKGVTDHAKAATEAAFTPVQVIDYRPNRVAIDVAGAGPGYLVLADVWFPGWTCTIDGKATEVLRANYLFRGVPLPNGAREVVFAFAPRSYELGRVISGTGLMLVVLVVVWGWVLSQRRRRSSDLKAT